MLDASNLTNLMAMPIKCMLPLAKVLKVKPKLGKDVGNHHRSASKALNSMGVVLWKYFDEWILWMWMGIKLVSS